ncbi:homoserine O-acetyltransferase MetA [Aminipila sp.]|uniref:homoserine O-acetyltransferase MetA n=1 Tax=Aminipila sp. TaxID=2060095 RepID=UPI00289FCCB0|nr:homoserine O-succinyltransferase [Aminipila sp.]
MPLIIPDKLPAGDLLQKENIFVMHDAAAIKQDIRPLRILMVNLMPDKAATETQLARVLANSPLQVELTLLRMGTHESKNVLEEYLDTFYKTFDEIKGQRFDGMILTGAPVETLSFEEVDYWEELCQIFKYSKTNVYSSMYICWGAQAGLYYHFGIDKYPMDEKMFGVFEHKVTRAHSPLLRGFDDVFWAPHSRYTQTLKSDIVFHPEIRILAESEEAGPHILATDNGRQIFIIGHQEYDRETLGLEYYRDVRQGGPVSVPKNYFKDDQPGKDVVVRWRGHASMLFANWLNYYVYQETPYDLTQL